ncbi:Integrase [Ferrimonas sediminum]|uniref:Integrase n=1 Tax=Ferrimonas sediminum TaxID=718193 RepID=A0A1G8PZJ9_9GAMM|nr:integrase domain-containing protein [Ferrimonas sediminum]SDI97280.1 Integrase [Ferrimonas sediminum]
MGRRTLPLTDTQIRLAKPTKKNPTLYDGQGLELKLDTSGSKLWRLRYQHPFTRKRKYISLGAYPAVTLANARDKRSEAQALLAQDIDPHQHWKSEKVRRQLAHATSLRAVAEQWFEVKKTKVTDDYATDIWSSLELHVFPELGSTAIGEITAPLFIDVLRPLATKGTLETLRRVCSRVNQIMTFATNTGVIIANPLAKVQEAFPAPKKQHLPSIQPEQLPVVLAQIANTQVSLAVRNCFFWSLHAIARPGEAANLQWDDIDWDNQLVCIPAERMKRRRRHVIPLTPPMIKILETMKPVSGKDQYVFKSPNKPTGPINSQSVNAALKRMGLKDTLCSHGLRSIASTALNDHGFEPDLIETALAHLDKNETRASYNRSEYVQRRRAMMEWWSNFIVQAQVDAITQETDTIA